MATCTFARLALACISFTVCTLMFGARLYALPDTTYLTGERILAVTRLNTDCIPDTLVGRMDSQFQYVPTKIYWGGWDTLHAPLCPPDIYHHRPRYQATTLEFPSWPHFSASCAVERLNSDTLSDVVFYLWGYFVDTTGAVRDTGRAIALFGQGGLDTLATVNISSVTGFQSFPYFAIELHPGGELAEPAVRDPSGVTSYAVSRLAISIPGNPPKPESAAVEDQGTVELYPNPAATSTQMEGHMVPPGDYAVEVISVNGSLERAQDVRVAETGDLFRVIDLRDLPSGYYLVRLSRHGKLFGTYPIIVKK
jgi:hypothetical protein